MKTSTNKSSLAYRAIMLIAIFAMTVFMAFMLIACNKGDDKAATGGDTPATDGPNTDDPTPDDPATAKVIKKYNATLNAGIRMGTPEPVSFADILSATYVTEENGNYTLTLVFKVGEISVMDEVGKIFVDDNPDDPDKVGDIENGTIGYYNNSGELVTDGVKLTYSSGDDYETNAKQQNVYYVKSAEMPVDSLRSEYSLTMYVSSIIMGKQFSNDSYTAKLAIDLESGEQVTEISGLGVATRGVVSADAPDVDDDDDDDDDGDDSDVGTPVVPADGQTVKYNASLDASFMGDRYSFGVTLTGAYITNDGGEYMLTLTFGATTLEIMTVKANVYVIANGSLELGYYDMSGELESDVQLTYGKGYVENASNGYISCVTSMAFPVDIITDVYFIDVCFGSDNAMGNDKPYVKAPVRVDLASGTVAEGGVSGLGNAAPSAAPKAVTSMTFTVDSVEDSYTLAVYVTAFNATTTSGMQFPYSGGKYNAVLSIDTDSATDNGNGETAYDASLDAVVTMGATNAVNFTENLLKSVVVKQVADKYEITLNFDFGTVNMPFNNVMTGYMNGATASDYGGGMVEPEFGYYVGANLITEGVTLTYNTDEA